MKRYSSGMKLERTGTFKLHAGSANFLGEYAEILECLYVTKGTDVLDKPLRQHDFVLTPQEMVELIIFLGYRPANRHEARILKSFGTEKLPTLVYFNDEEEEWQYIDRKEGTSDSMPHCIDSHTLLSELLEEDSPEYGLLLIRK